MADISLVFVLDAHMPFVRHPDSPGCVEESWFFNALSNTYLPLLRTCTTLETEGIPFKLAIAFSPTLCEMMADPLLQERYISHLDKSIEFGLAELDRSKGSVDTREHIRSELDRIELNRRDFCDIYERNILPKFDYFAMHGYLEILATTATSCFLPLYSDIPEAINAQIETGLLVYRKHFTAIPTGFWLPAMAWCPRLAPIIKAYGFQYTFVDSHAVLFADPPSDTGVFSPAICSNGLLVFARDFFSLTDVTSTDSSFDQNKVYLDTERDVGFELSESLLSPLFDVHQGRRITGFRYYAKSAENQDQGSLYDEGLARTQIEEDARQFIQRRFETLNKASSLLEGAPVSICATYPASLFGQSWYEGPAWLEATFRQLAVHPELSAALPCQRAIPRQLSQPIEPYCSSGLQGGYAEDVLNSANDWMYPYIRKATLRMIDLAERFPDDNGLKERALNMSARELLLAQSMDWFIMMNDREHSDYAKRRFQESVRAFTVVYESLGSNFISTEWLTKIEKVDNLFPEINYRVYSKKK